MSTHNRHEREMEKYNEGYADADKHADLRIKELEEALMACSTIAEGANENIFKGSLVTSLNMIEQIVGKTLNGGASESKPILDACCGSRMFWFDKVHPSVLFADQRTESHVLCDGRKLEIKPDVQMDFRAMPFSENTFRLVVFDPPHLDNAGKNGWQAKKYGCLGENWPLDLKRGVDECFRVLKDYGVLIFKWNEQRFPVSAVIEAIGREPLFGHRTMQNNKTIWMTFMKFPNASHQHLTPGGSK